MPIKTLNRLIDRCLQNHPRDDAFAYRKRGYYNNVSTEEFARRVKFLGLGLVDLGVESGDRIAILSENRLEWAIADLSTLSIGAVNIPVYSSLPSQQILHILQDSWANIIIVSDSRQLDKILALRDYLPEELLLVTMDGLFSKLSEKVQSRDLATIIYTSGTTGPPKGVMLTHGNIVSNILAITEIIPVDRNDSVLSFLPLSHILERTAGFYSIMFIGGRIAYAASIDTLGEDVKATSPTLVIAVPRFLEKIYERIHEKVSEGSRFKKKLFDWSVSIGREAIGRNPGGPSGGQSRSWRYRIANQLVFSKLKEELGGRIRFIISGGAPLPVEIAQFYHAIGIPVYEGYGLTETSPVISCNTPLKLKIGSVGPPVPGVDVKIAGDGEILVRGPNVMTGYFGMEKKTEEVIRDGWFHTGDIGRIDEKGFLHITDRKKDIIITSGGKNIAPQPIEMLLKRSRFINEIVLTGNKRKHITALIVPDFDQLKKIALNDTNDFNDQGALNNNQTIRDIFEKEIRKQTGSLCSYEQVKKFRLLSRKFRISGGELTPTMKVRRSLVEELYKDLIDEMYS
jgi:long-chain acyl-CoA synthetase